MTQSTHTSIQLAGKTAFDQRGKKVLVNNTGKAFAIDETIEELWKEIEGLVSSHSHQIESIDSLAHQVKTKAPTGEIKKVLHKLQEHDLLIFE